MKRFFIGLIAVVLLVSTIVTVVMALPRTLSPSQDPVDKGGEAPNYYYEKELDTDEDKYVGPDGYEYFGEFYGGLFWIGNGVDTLVSEEAFSKYTDDVYAGVFDFNQRSFCRYFGITEEQYKEAISHFSKYEIYGDGGKYIAEKYPVGIFGSYENFVEVFVREEYRDGYKTEECIPGDDCPHTFVYHTISDELIEYVGEQEYSAFKEKYHGSEDFNILNFIEYFEIAESDMQAILDSSEDQLPAYNIKCLYGEENIQREYFLILSKQ